VTAATIRRHEVRRLIDRDEAYDEDPTGDPPISVPRYRGSLRAVLAVQAAEPGPLASAWSAGEREAYRAGGLATLRAVIEAIGQALTVPPTPPSDPPPLH
jgi:hypothetical protein